MGDIFGLKRKINTKKSLQTNNTIPQIIGGKSLAEMQSMFGFNRDGFEESQYDLSEIRRAADTDSYIRRAFDIHVETSLRQGYQFKSRNKEAVSYIRNRFAHIGLLSGRPLDSILEGIFDDLITYSNVFIYLVRDNKSLGNPIKLKSGKTLKPVAAIKLLDPTSVKIHRNKHGKVIKYRQQMNTIGGEYVDFSADDIVHIYHNRKDSCAFGTPYVVPVLADVKLLRRLEQNVELLTIKHLFPLYQYIVGTEKFPAKESELKELQRIIHSLPTDGAIVTPERHKIDVINGSDATLDITPFLEYLENRIFTGLGVSSVSMGRGGTANRGTSDTLDKILQDRCKFYQGTVSTFFNCYLLIPLLLEGGFSLQSADDEDLVRLSFGDTDIDREIKLRNQVIQEWNNDLITSAEARVDIGRDPLSEEEKQNTYTTTIGKINSEYAMEETAKKQSLSNENSNKVRPANQHGKKTSSTSPTKDVQDRITINLLNDLRVEKLTDYLETQWRLTRDDITNAVLDLKEDDMYKSFDKSKLSIVINLTKEAMLTNVKSHMLSAFTLGLNKCYDKHQFTMDTTVSTVRANKIRDNVDIYINKLLSELADKVVHKIVNTESPDELVLNANSVFDSLQYRLKLIARTETVRAYNYGIASGLQASGKDKAVCESTEDSCEKCKEAGSRDITLNPILLDEMPPFHPNCLDTIKL